MQQQRTGVWVAMVLVCTMLAQADTTRVRTEWVSGTWTPAGSPYVVDSISVQVHPDSTLLIEPGVEVYFGGPYFMIVRGRLTAIGNAADLISFVGWEVDTLEDAWRGLVFISTDTSTADSSRLNYVALTRANGRGYKPGTGGAIQCIGASPRFEDCSLLDNRTLRSRLTRALASRHGGGAYLWRSNAHFVLCDFVANNPGPIGLGGAAFCDTAGAPFFDRCSMYENIAGSGGGVAVNYSPAVFQTCVITQNTASFNGGGVHLYYAGAQFNDCVISENVSGQCGGAVYVLQGQHFFDGCEMANNQSFWGGALFCYVSNPILERCLMRGNSGGYGGAVYAWQANPFFYFCTLTHSTNTHGGGAVVLNESGGFLTGSVVSYSEGAAGIEFLSSPYADVEYCDVAANTQGSLAFYPDEAAGPLNIGVMSQTNANGDSCDDYHNIYLDPDFVDAAGGDFLPDWNSPLINAGSPQYDPDPDGSVADIGAFYRDVMAADWDAPLLPREVALQQNYPNPFNHATQISFDLPTAGDAELSVYDLTGRCVARLLSGRFSAGRQDVNWNAGSLSSGVYVYRLRAEGVDRARKMILLK